jgi:hypothetical protein
MGLVAHEREDNRSFSLANASYYQPGPGIGGAKALTPKSAALAAIYKTLPYIVGCTFCETLRRQSGRERPRKSLGVWCLFKRHESPAKQRRIGRRQAKIDGIA